MTGYSSTLDGLFYTGSSTSSTTPSLYPVAINGRGYLLDFSFSPYRREAFRHRSIAALRAQADTSNVPGEASLNPSGLWRRTQDTWHKGAGQRYLDRNDSDDARFYVSKGINPWTRGQISLLPATASKRASANTNLALMVAGSRLYITDGNTIAYSTDITGVTPTFTACTGLAAANPTSIASDGTYVYTSHTASGIYLTNTGTGATASWITGNVTMVRYVKGRLIATYQNLLYNVTTGVGTAGPTALPAALYTHPNPSWTWVDSAEGPSNIYLAGYAGDKSLIYRTAVKADGTALDIPIVAGELPDGEIVRRIQGYIGFLMVGTDKGVRFCTLDTSGNVVLGDLISTTSAVQAFEPQDRYVWYGITNYDSTSTGLGRLDLRTFNDGAPAYAADLMATTQGAVLDACTFQSLRLFAVSGAGFYGQTTDMVASGTIDSGIINYGIADPKVPVFLHYDSSPLAGSYTAYLSLDGGTFTTVDTISTLSSVTEEMPTLQTLSDHFEIRSTLTRSSVDTTTGPTILRYTLRANPAAPTGYDIIVPIRLAEELLVGGTETQMIPSQELAILDELRMNRRVIIYQEGSSSYTVTLEGIDWIPDSLGRYNTELNGVCVVSMKTLV